MMQVDVPQEVLQYGRHEGFETGKRGMLALRLALEGRTVVKEQRSQVPLFAQKALYLQESLPEMAYMYIISPSGGILQGDTYSIDIQLEKGAQAHFTTQGATRIYRMEKGFAVQSVNISAEEGSYLEYMPDQIIPYAGSRFYQKTSLSVHPEAIVVYSEVITPGRTAMGESFQYDVCYLRVDARDHRGLPRFSDAAVLEPKKRAVKEFGVLDRDVVGTVYVMCPARLARKLAEQANLSLEKLGIIGGASVLPREAGISARMLGDSAGELHDAAHEIAAATRKLVLGAPFGKMRKG
jgi:urease accessory protein